MAPNVTPGCLRVPHPGAVTWVPPESAASVRENRDLHKLRESTS
jgi:hypothetical protein